MKIGLIGLGAMGSRMAKNFMAAGHDLYVHNRSEARAAALVADGATWCESPKRLAETADVIVTVLRDDQASQEVWLDPARGIVAGLDGEKLAIECSTISHDWALQLAEHLREYRYIEAPLVGSRPQADAKQLVILVGGEKSHYEKAAPLLALTSAKTLHLGAHGQAIAFKLVINALLAVQTAAFAELFSALHKGGFAKPQLQQLLGNLPVTSPVMTAMLEFFVQEDYAPRFPIELVAKDLGYALAFIEGTGSHGAVTASIHDLYQVAEDSGHGEQNISGILDFYSKKAR